MACAPSEDPDLSNLHSLIRAFAVRMKKALVLSYTLRAQRRHWSDWADAQADLSLRWAHSHIVGFVMSRLICPVYALIARQELLISYNNNPEEHLGNTSCWFVDCFWSHWKSIALSNEHRERSLVSVRKRVSIFITDCPNMWNVVFLLGFTVIVYLSNDVASESVIFTLATDFP